MTKKWIAGQCLKCNELKWGKNATTFCSKNDKPCAAVRLFECPVLNQMYEEAFGVPLDYFNVD